MSYTSGTRSLQNNAAEDLYQLVKTQMAAHGNYTFVEDYSTATYIWSVWKVGALNSNGVPYYQLFCRTIADGLTLYVGLCEDYNAATHSFYRATPYASTTARVVQSDGSYGGATATVLPNATSINPSLQTSALTQSASAYDYWIAVNNDGIWIGSRVGATSAASIVLGTFDSLVVDPATNDPICLFNGGNTANSTSTAYTTTTRHPLLSGSLAYVWGAYEWFSTSIVWPSLAAAGSVGGTNGDLFQNGKAIGARIAVRTFASQRGASITTYGANRGLFRHMLYFAIAAGVTAGDTITVGGATYAYMGNGNVFYEISAP